MGVKLVKPINFRSVKSITAIKFQNTMQVLEVRSDFAVAVSGGPDSLALLFLSKQYAEDNNLNFIAIGIDHSLRTNSKDEIQWVKKFLKKKKIKFYSIKWEGKKPQSNIMALAREKRYQLLTNHCKKLKIPYLLTAHHLDDEIENFLMRLIRGSGLKGLSSLKPRLKHKKTGVYIVRPLLEHPKKSLIKYLATIKQAYIEDPTNKDNRFDRTRIRILSSKLITEGLNKSRFLNVISNLKKSENAIISSIDFYLREIIINENKNSIKINLRKFIEMPDEIQFRILVKIASLVGMKKQSLRAQSVLNLINKINKADFKQATFNKCLFKRSQGFVNVIPEKGRAFELLTKKS